MYVAARLPSQDYLQGGFYVPVRSYLRCLASLVEALEAMGVELP